jgi:hypothetical protein
MPERDITPNLIPASVNLTATQVREFDRKGPSALRRAGCTCEFGCRTCGRVLDQMGNCPAWAPCPTGRALGSNCPVHGNA